jgi:protein O-mannosyl-transferase
MAERATRMGADETDRGRRSVESRRALAFFVLIFAITVSAYLPAMRGGFVWDDNAHVTKPALRSLHGLSRIWFELGATQQYYPLLHTAFWLEHKAWGDNTLGYHLTNVLLHAAAACLVYLILLRLKIPGAILAAAIFAVHPVEVESVAWISEQKNTLSAVFYLTAMLMYLKFDESRQKAKALAEPVAPDGAKWHLLALVLFTLGMLTKTVTATLPAALLVIFWWQRGKLSWRNDVLPLVPFFLLAAAAGGLTAWVERKLIGAEGAAFELSLLQRGLIAGRAIWFYLGKLVWPSNLVFIYPRWIVDPAVWWQWLFPLAALAATALLWAARKRWRAPLAGWLFFVGTLFPALGFLNVYPFIYSFVADHFQYLAGLGLITLVAAAMATAAKRAPQPLRQIGTLLAAGLVGLLALLTWQQCEMYGDVVALYQTTIARNPACWLAYNNLGDQYLIAHRLPQAIEQFEAALRLNPNCSEAHNNLGEALSKSGHLPAAIEHFRQALRSKPGFTAAELNLAYALLSAGQIPQAIEHYQRAQALAPELAEASMGLATALEKAGRLDEAADQYRRAIRQQTDFVDARLHLGNVLAQLGRPREAVDEYLAALRLAPDFADAHANCGTVLLELGRADEAIAHFREVVRLEPAGGDGWLDLAKAYAAAGRASEAVSAAEKARDLAKTRGDGAQAAEAEGWLKEFRGHNGTDRRGPDVEGEGR